MTSVFWQFFDNVQLINLDKRTDRLKSVTDECNRVGLSFQRFKALEGDNRHLAFNKSQYYALKQHGERTLVLEDDVMFKSIDHLPAALGELPDDWDILYLGANLLGTDTMQWKMPEKYSAHLFRVFNCWQTHAVAYSSKMAKWIVENFPYHTDEYEREGLIIYDEWLRINVLPNFKCFVVAPQVALQSPGFSDIWQNDGDYTSLFTRGNEILK